MDYTPSLDPEGSVLSRPGLPSSASPAPGALVPGRGAGLVQGRAGAQNHRGPRAGGFAVGRLLGSTVCACAGQENERHSSGGGAGPGTSSGFI